MLTKGTTWVAGSPVNTVGKALALLGLVLLTEQISKMSRPNYELSSQLYNPVPFKIPSLWAGVGKSDIPKRDKGLT